MTPAEYDFTIYKGTTSARVLTYRDSAGTLVNLTGQTARMYLKKSILADTTSLELTSANGKLVLGGALGTITINFSATDSATLAVGTYLYDLELINGATITKLIKGDITVLKGVSS